MCCRVLHMEQSIFIAHKNTSKQASDITCYVLYVGGKKCRLINPVYTLQKLKKKCVLRDQKDTFLNQKTCKENATNYNF